jgi:hypothetical protein
LDTDINQYIAKLTVCTITVLHGVLIWIKLCRTVKLKRIFLATIRAKNYIPKQFYSVFLLATLLISELCNVSFSVNNKVGNLAVQCRVRGPTEAIESAWCSLKTIP